jgi:hypothetical protein
VLAFAGLDPSPGVRDAVVSSASPGARHQRRTSADIEASGMSEEGKRLHAAFAERSGPVYQEARRREPAAGPSPPSAPSPAARDESLPRGLAEQLAEVRAVLEAREVELASIKPVLVARSEEVDSVKRVLAARDEQLASVLPALAAREGEVASLKEQMAALAAALNAKRAALADRERLLGSLKGVMVAIKRLVAPRR